MIYSIFFIGLIATFIGAVPPGASNLAVIKTTVQENIQESLKIGYGAGVCEVLLALTALSFGMIVQDIITIHIWIQIAVFISLAVIGIYFIKRKKEKEKSSRSLGSKYITGFLLSIMNPPVLVYWVLVFSFLKGTFDFQPDATLLLLLIAGIFLGKVVTLYGYSKLGTHLANKSSKKKTNINSLIGSVLIGISVLQGLKLLLF